MYLGMLSHVFADKHAFGEEKSWFWLRGCDLVHAGCCRDVTRMSNSNPDVMGYRSLSPCLGELGVRLVVCCLDRLYVGYVVFLTCAKGQRSWPGTLEFFPSGISSHCHPSTVLLLCSSLSLAYLHSFFFLSLVSRWIVVLLFVGCKARAINNVNPSWKKWCFPVCANDFSSALAGWEALSLDGAAKFVALEILGGGLLSVLWY